MNAKLTLVLFVNVFCFWRCAISGPTVIPADPFDAEKDAEIIWKAVDCWGTEEDDINKVLCKRPFLQREKIAAAYEEKHGSLIKKLEKETSGDLRQLYRRLLESRQQIMSIDLHDTIEGKRKEYGDGTVTEIICGTDGEDKGLIAAYYFAAYNMDVMEHVKKYKQGDEAYQKFMYDYCWRSYCLIPKLDATKAFAVAKNLVAIDAKTDCEGFKAQIQLLYKTYCLPDIQLIFINYRSLANCGIDETIDSIMKGSEAGAYKALTLSTENRYRYYANLIHQACDGFGTDEDLINRITVCTCERYLGDIDNEYRCMFKESIYDRISGVKGEFAFKGDYKDCMKKLYGK